MKRSCDFYFYVVLCFLAAEVVHHWIRSRSLPSYKKFKMVLVIPHQNGHLWLQLDQCLL